MSLPDSLAPTASAILSMTEQDYIVLLVKLGGLVVSFLAAAATVLGIIYSSGLFVWRLMLRSLRADLSTTFCTPAQLTQAMAVVTDRLDDGDARMKRTEDDARETREEVKLTREGVEQLNRRFLRILSLLVTHGDSLSKNPSLQAAMESDDSDFFPPSPGVALRAG